MKKGFTLIELVATITVLAIILAMVVIDTKHFREEQSRKERDHIKTIIEENTKVLVETNNTINTKVNDNLQALEEEKELDSSVQVKCIIKYKKLEEAKLMDKDTEYPTDEGNKKITNKSYIIVSLDSDNDFNYEFVYVDDDSTPTLTNCLN